VPALVWFGPSPGVLIGFTARQNGFDMRPLGDGRHLGRERQDLAPEQRDTLAQQSSGVQIGKGGCTLG
jgi:hypothetical protein